MEPREYIQGKGVLVTGGSSGIGLAFARKAAGLGARVYLAARRKSVLEEAKADIEKAHPSAKVEIIDLDVAKGEEVDAKIGALLEKNDIDILVNNAGIARPGRFLELPAEEFRHQMDVNYFGTVNMCRAVLPHMIARKKGGHVLNVSSLAGVIGIYGYTAYAPTKFALCGFSQVLRAEMWPHKIRVSVVLPPDTDTPQLAFENQYKPAETRAIAGTVKTRSADEVASTMMRGIASGEFEIYCDVTSKMSGFAQGLVPGVVRWFCDEAQKKVGSSPT